MKIVLDAGHGYQTPGKRSPNGMREFEFNRDVANYTKQMLLNYENVEIIFTHSDERDVPLTERTDQANRLNVDIFISIHANAYGSGGWNSVNGIETYVYTSRPKEAYEVANVIHKNLIEKTGRTSRDVRAANFHVLRETKMTAILCECGFMTNKEEAALLKTAVYRKSCAEAIVNGLVSYYRLMLKSVSNVTDLWMVQVGAFSKKENAEKCAAMLKEKGFDAFLYKK